MSRVAKITISLSNDTLEAIERMRRARQQTRSEFVRQAVAEVLHREEEQEAEARYIRGYREHPETDEEIEAIHQAGVAVLAQEPWE